jgi:flavin-dependent dehydrogenase
MPPLVSLSETLDPPIAASGPLPPACDVLVVGAGPAGTACAIALARAGREVWLVDQHAFPRDKVCGDGLIPDSHAALARLGVAETVAALATPVRHVRCVGPRGGHVDVPGTLSVLPRKALDALLLRAALAAGAKLAPPLRFEAPLRAGEAADAAVVGARFRRPGDGTGPTLEVRSRWLVLATGAVPQALQAAGVCERHTPSGIAIRGYVAHAGLAQTLRELHMVWHPRLRGGYGWIFPAPGGRFNIGAGLTGSHIRTRAGKGRMQDVNLRGMFQAFCEVYAPARELAEHGQWEGGMKAALKGAPLRCSLIGAAWSAPGLLVTGEAAGSTYAFSGEGIGKALETGLLAADALRDEARLGGPAEVRRAYEANLAALKPRFDLYETASRVNHHPWLADLVIWRANKSPRIRQRLSGMLEETQNPGKLFTWRGMGKLMFE